MARASPKKDRAYSAAEEAVNREIKEKESTSMKVDFSAVSLTPEPRKAGDYPGTLIGHLLNLASASSGQPTLRIDYSDDENPSRIMYANYSLQPQALWKIKRDLIRVGASVEEMNSPQADIEAIVQGLYGYKAVLQYGDPREGTDKEGNPRLYDNFLGVKDPKAE